MLIGRVQQFEKSTDRLSGAPQIIGSVITARKSLCDEPLLLGGGIAKSVDISTKVDRDDFPRDCCAHRKNTQQVLLPMEHEIGVLKALGARRRHIRLQFLGEALALSIIGGICGYLLAILLASWIGTIPFLSELFKDPSHQGDIYLAINTRVFLNSFITFAFIGLLSGTWPAVKASRLDPVESLRME